jgi:hypothetical protein
VFLPGNGHKLIKVVVVVVANGEKGEGCLVEEYSVALLC